MVNSLRATTRKDLSFKALRVVRMTNTFGRIGASNSSGIPVVDHPQFDEFVADSLGNGRGDVQYSGQLAYDKRQH